MPLEGEGGECISSAEDWHDTKDGIDKFYRNWSLANNISGKIKIITRLSLVQLKLNTGTFQLGVFDTVTLGRDEMKERMSRKMSGEHTNIQYGLFPRSLCYINDKNKCLSTRGVDINIMKDDISPAQFIEDMVKQWQGIEESSGNTLASQFFVPGGRGADLGTITMTKIFHRQNHFLSSTKMKLVHNLGDMDEVLYLELNEHVDI
jgi:hypothetical protein